MQFKNDPNLTSSLATSSPSSNSVELSAPKPSSPIAPSQSQQIPSTSKAPKKGGDITVSAEKRSQVSKREAMSQAAQDAQEANRVYAQTYLTVLKAGTEEFTDSLTQHLGDMRQNLLEVEDDDDFLAQLMSGGCGGSLPI